MITGLLYDKKEDKKAFPLEEEIRYQIALHTDDESRIVRCLKGEELTRFMEQYDLLDFACMDAAGLHGPEQARRIRAHYPQTAIMILADSSVSPASYIRPSIMPSSVIIRPVDRKQMRASVREFMDAWMQDMDTAEEESFLLKRKDGITRIPYARIACFEASMKRVLIRLDTEEFLCFDTLDELQRNLPDSFLRCHRGFIVNSSRIRRYLASESLLVLDNQMQIPVSRSYRGLIRRIMMERKKSGNTI